MARNDPAITSLAAAYADSAGSTAAHAAHAASKGGHAADYAAWAVYAAAHAARAAAASVGGIADSAAWAGSRVRDYYSSLPVACADSAAEAAAYVAYFADRASADFGFHGSSAIKGELERVTVTRSKGSWLNRRVVKECDEAKIPALLGSPLSPGYSYVGGFWDFLLRLEEDLRSLNAGFDVWIDWYRNRLEGKPIDWGMERKWVLSTHTYAL